MDENELVEFFKTENWSSDNFFDVFKFLEMYIDLNQSKPLGIFYAKELYAHMCAETYRTLVWYKAEAGLRSDTHDLTTLGLTFRLIAKMPAFEHVTLKEFKQLHGKTMYERFKARTLTDIPAPVARPHFRIGAPPAPSRELLSPSPPVNLHQSIENRVSFLETQA